MEKITEAVEQIIHSRWSCCLCTWIVNMQDTRTFEGQILLGRISLYLLAILTAIPLYNLWKVAHKALFEIAIMQMPHLFISFYSDSGESPFLSTLELDFLERSRMLWERSGPRKRVHVSHIRRLFFSQMFSIFYPFHSCSFFSFNILCLETPISKKFSLSFWRTLKGKSYSIIRRVTSSD